MRRTLLRPALAGLRKHQQFKAGQWIGRQQLHSAQWEAIIDLKTHEKVVATLTDPKRVTNHGQNELKYLLTGLVDCGACGQSMVGAKAYEYQAKGSYVRKDGSRPPDRTRVFPARYQCPHAGCHGVTRRMDSVDEYVQQHIVALLEAEGLRVFDCDRAVAGEARAQIEVAKSKLALLSDKWMDGVLTDETFAQQNAKEQSQIEGAHAQLRATQPPDELAVFTGATAATAWSAADIAQKREVLKALIDRVGLRIRIEKIGSGAFSAAGPDRYAGIKVEWA